MRYEYKTVHLEFQAGIQDAILQAVHGLNEFDQATWVAVQETLESTLNQYGEQGWKLWGWSLQPAPHIILERARPQERAQTEGASDG